MHPAYVLHRWPYQESSLIVDVFSQEFGRLRVVARGARASKKGQNACLQPFTPIQLSWRGQGELKTLTAVESTSFPAPLVGEYVYCGFYINELLQRLVPEQAAIPALFDDYQHTLQLLRQQVAMQPVLRRFEWSLLQHLELDFDWQVELSHGQAIEPDSYYFFVAGEGFYPLASGREPPPHYRGADIVKMAQFQLHDTDLLRQFKWLMRAALAPYLGNKPLRSRELFTR